MRAIFPQQIINFQKNNDLFALAGPRKLTFNRALISLVIWVVLYIRNEYTGYIPHA